MGRIVAWGVVALVAYFFVGLLFENVIKPNADNPKQLRIAVFVVAIIVTAVVVSVFAHQ